MNGWAIFKAQAKRRGPPQSKTLVRPSETGEPREASGSAPVLGAFKPCDFPKQRGFFFQREVNECGH
jgi:hypothetical protein